LLIAGFDPDSGLDAALCAAGYTPVHWRRFAATASDAAAAPWPPPAEHGAPRAAAR